MLIKATKRTCPHCRDTHLCAEPAPPETNHDPAAVKPHLGEYADQWLEPVFSRADGTSSQALYEHYRRWADRNGYLPLGRKTFAQWLTTTGYRAFKRSRIFYFVRIRDTQAPGTGPNRPRYSSPVTAIPADSPLAEAYRPLLQAKLREPRPDDPWARASQPHPCAGCGCPRKYHDADTGRCSGDFLHCPCKGYTPHTRPVNP